MRKSKIFPAIIILVAVFEHASGSRRVVSKAEPVFLKPRRDSQEFWGLQTPEKIKKDFDKFALEAGGILGPYRKSVPAPDSQKEPGYYRVGKFHQPDIFPSHGCEDDSGFHFEGEAWFSRGCRRHRCLYFRGRYFIETDSCDTEIYNTTYKCVVEANLKENYPRCCPKYVCNPDNLGNRISVAQ